MSNPKPQPIPSAALPRPAALSTPVQTAPLRQLLAGGRRPMASAGGTPVPIAMPSRTHVAALSKPEAYDRWKAGIRSASDIGANVITIYDVIGEDFWSGGGVTVARIDAALRRIGNQAVEVHVNSPGGDMFEGIAIYNRLLQHPAPITIKVMGLAASAASIIAMAGSDIQIGPASFLMIHNCWVVAQGDRNELQETVEWLGPFDDAMAGVYAQRTGVAKADVVKMLDAETWLNGAQAIELGFANTLLNPDDMQEDEGATADAQAFNAVRQAELGLCRSMSRTEARGLINKIKGTPGAARDAVKPDASGSSWVGAAADLITLLKS